MSGDGARRSDRVCLTLFLEVEGTDGAGQTFMEPARTLLISRHGGVVVLNRILRADQEIQIRRKSSHEAHRKGPVRVIGQFGRQGDGYIYGVALVDAETDLWGVEFPSLAESVEAVARMLLECSYCRGREVIYLDELELKGFELNRGIARHCKTCGVPSFWTQAPHEDPKKVKGGANGQAAPWPEQRASGGVAGGSSGRVRLKTRLTACVREASTDDELAVCEEISRDGLSFRSRKHYTPETRIEIAVPYTQDTANIFVPARIVQSEEMREVGLFRHGANFVKPDKAAGRC